MKRRALLIVFLAGLTSCGRTNVADLTRDLESPDPLVRARSAYKLGQTGQRAAGATLQLIRLLGDDSEVERRHVSESESSGSTTPGDEAATALTKIGEPAVAPLIRAFDEYPAKAGLRAVNAIVEIGLPAVLPLREALHDGNVAIRLGAVTALGRIGDRQAVDELLSATIFDSSQEVSNEAARVILVLDPKVVADMTRLLSNGGRESRIAAVRVLARLPHRDAVAAAFGATADRDDAVRAAAQESLSAVNTQLVNDLLAGGLYHGGFESSIWFATEQLAKRKDPRSTKSLLSYETRHPGEVPRLILQELGSLAVPGLVEGFGINARRAAFYLGELRDARAVQPLIELIKNTFSDDERLAAVSALKRINDPETVSLMLNALDRAEPNDADGLCWALGEMKDGRAVDALVAQLNSPSYHARGDAAEALGKIGSGRAIGPLIEALGAPNAGGVPPHCARALQLITGEDFGLDADKWLEWYQSR